MVRLLLVLLVASIMEKSIANDHLATTLDCSFEHNDFRQHTNDGTPASPFNSELPVQPKPLYPLQPLTHSNEAATIAKEYLDLLNTNRSLCSGASDFVSCSQNGLCGTIHGENLHISATSVPSGISPSCDNSVGTWYAGIKDYNFIETPPPSTGSFTQVVWAGATIVGCASLKCSIPASHGDFTGMYITWVLCRYDSGNCAQQGIIGRPYIPSKCCEASCGNGFACADNQTTCPAAGYGSSSQNCPCGTSTDDSGNLKLSLEVYIGIGIGSLAFVIILVLIIVVIVSKINPPPIIINADYEINMLPKL